MSIDYHLMRPQEAESTSRMILRSFNKFNASELTSDGVALMLEYVTPAALKHRQHQNHLIFVAVEDDKVIGMAETRDYSLLSLLYVDPDRLQAGIATELWSHVKLMCKQAKPGLSEIRVESSSYAIPVYEKLGFTQSGEKTVKNGIPIQPMVYRFSDDEMQHVRAEFTQALDASPDDVLKAILFEFRNALSPVVSGATLGVWRHERLSEADLVPLAEWQVERQIVPLPYRADLPTLEETQALLAHWRGKESAARRANDQEGIRDAHAMIERQIRWLTRLSALPPGDNFPFPYTLMRLGNAIWLGVEGEPYNLLQRTLRERFGDLPVLVMVLSGGSRAWYLPTAETYGKGIYQEAMANLAPGCLEKLIGAVESQISRLVENKS